MQSSHSITSVVSGPILCTVIDARQLYNLMLNPVDINVRQTGENQFARTLINCLDKSSVILQVMAQHLLSEFVCPQAPLSGDFG